jgi:hypothetical protein
MEEEREKERDRDRERDYDIRKTGKQYTYVKDISSEQFSPVRLIKMITKQGHSCNIYKNTQLH